MLSNQKMLRQEYCQTIIVALGLGSAAAAEMQADARVIEWLAPIAGKIGV